tara:strand:- start:297 stop:488 length:192 start_codon:yes stop_codon:yes gene_type:complete
MKTNIKTGRNNTMSHDRSKCTGCEWCSPEIASEQAKIEAELDELEEDAYQDWYEYDRAEQQAW